MNSIIFDNFKFETGYPVESDGKNNLHDNISSPTTLTSSIGNFYLYPLSNDIPAYSLSGWDEIKLADYTTLVGSISWNKFVDGISIKGHDSSSYYTYLIDTKGNVSVFVDSGPTNAFYKVSPNTSTDFDGAWIESLGNKLIVSGGYGDRFYYTILDNNFNTNTWNAVTTTAGSYPKVMLSFKNNLFISATVPTTDSQEVRRYNSSLSYVGSLQIPTNNAVERVVALFNYNDTYIGIVLRTTSGDYLMFWDGDINSGVSKKILCPGTVIGARAVNGYVFVMVRRINGFDLYVLNGDSWSLYYEYRKSNVVEFTTNRVYKKLNSIDNYLVIDVGDKLLFIDTLSKSVFNIGYNGSVSFQTTSGAGIYLKRYGSVYDQNKNFFVIMPIGGNGEITYFHFANSNPTRQNYFYKSNWIFLGKRIKLTKVRLYYTNPTNPDQYLNVKIWYIDEKRGGEIIQKDYSFLSSSLPKSYKEIDLGIECTKFALQVWVSYNTTSARILKRAIVDYSELE